MERNSNGIGAHDLQVREDEIGRGRGSHSAVSILERSSLDGRPSNTWLIEIRDATPGANGGCPRIGSQPAKLSQTEPAATGIARIIGLHGRTTGPQSNATSEVLVASPPLNLTPKPPIVRILSIENRATDVGPERSPSSAIDSRLWHHDGLPRSSILDKLQASLQNKEGLPRSDSGR